VAGGGGRVVRGRARTRRRWRACEGVGRAASQNHRPAQTAKNRTHTGCHEAQVTLSIHPRFGQTIVILRRYGPSSVWAEYSDGELTILPRAWTSLVPRLSDARLGERTVKLTIDVMLELTGWVDARCGDCQELDSSPRRGRKVDHEQHTGCHDGAASLVEQAGAPDRSGGSWKGGSR
jgi:hypothetical protein